MTFPFLTISILIHTYKHQKIINVQDLIREYRGEKFREKNKRTCTPIGRLEYSDIAQMDARSGNNHNFDVYDGESADFVRKSI